MYCWIFWIHYLVNMRNGIGREYKFHLLVNMRNGIVLRERSKINVTNIRRIFHFILFAYNADAMAYIYGNLDFAIRVRVILLCLKAVHVTE